MCYEFRHRKPGVCKKSISKMRVWFLKVLRRVTIKVRLLWLQILWSSWSYALSSIIATGFNVISQMPRICIWYHLHQPMIEVVLWLGISATVIISGVCNNKDVVGLSWTGQLCHFWSQLTQKEIPPNWLNICRMIWIRQQIWKCGESLLGVSLASESQKSVCNMHLTLRTTHPLVAK